MGVGRSNGRTKEEGGKLLRECTVQEEEEEEEEEERNIIRQARLDGRTDGKGLHWSGDNTPVRPASHFASLFYIYCEYRRKKKTAENLFFIRLMLEPRSIFFMKVFAAAAAAAATAIPWQRPVRASSNPLQNFHCSMKKKINFHHQHQSDVPLIFIDT